jgi:peptidoglycan/LPS O-acetylase OafA/YrhL
MSEKAGNSSRLAWLDALRGFAALCVVFDHGSTLLLLPVRSFLYQWLNLGQYGVFVFFLVSGYIVPASLERKGSIRAFWTGRLFRLYPMFLVAIALAAIAHATGHGTIANASRHPLTALLGWLFMLQNVTAGLNVPVVTWTLSYEMVFYLLLAALFAWGVHRHSGWYATAFAAGAVVLGGVLPMAALGRWTNGPGHSALVLNGCVDALVLAGLALSVLAKSWAARIGASLAGLVALVLVTFNQTYPYPWSGCVILALMFTGTVIYRAEKRQLSSGGATPRGRARWQKPPSYRTRMVASVATVVAVLALTTAAGVWHGGQRHYGHHWELQWATSVLLAGATFGASFAVGHLRGRRWRMPAWCAWLGMVSFSFYLLHPLVFDAYRSIPELHRKHTMTQQVLLFAALLAVIIALSALTYYLIERPMQRLGRRVATRLAPYDTGSGVALTADRAVPATSGASAVLLAESAADSGSSAAARRSASSSNAVAGGSGGSP